METDGERWRVRCRGIERRLERGREGWREMERDGGEWRRLEEETVRQGGMTAVVENNSA